MENLPSLEIEQIEKAIAALEAQRDSLGNSVTDAALEALRQHLARLRRQAMRAQRKQVTVLFAMLTGLSTPNTESTQTQRKAIWECLEQVVLARGGWIDKIVDDTLMALWGVEIAHEDDAEQAVRAALEMKTALAKNTPLPSQKKSSPRTDGIVALQIGIHSGPVMLSEVGTIGEYTAMGDTVNTAHRLLEAAAVSEILISQQTLLLAQGLFDTTLLAPLSLKGKSAPLQAHRVIRARQRAFRMHTRGIEGIETSMIGRQAQLQTLQEAFNRSYKKGQPQLIAIIGEAGVGKSRLLFEFERWLAGQVDQPTLFQGRTSPDTTHSAYSLFRDMFIARFNIQETDRPTQVLKKIYQGMRPHLNKQQVALVGQLVGFDLSSQPAVKNLLGSPAFRQLATAYLVNYYQMLAEQTPGVTIFLEDLHWADRSSLDMVEHLAAEIPAGRLLLICLARPTLFERYPHWGKRLPQSVFQHLDLLPLTDEESQALVQEILRKVCDLPPSLCTLIAETAEGNPFYLEELIKMLIDDSVIVRGVDCWQVLPDQLKEMHIPSTLISVLQARLAGLPKAEQEVLQRASVVGRTFWKGTLGYLTNENTEQESDPTLDDYLETLHRRELIYQRTTSAFASTQEFIFKHAILRDVTYETVLNRIRHLYHARVAQWLEANAGSRLNEYLGLIASHYERAGDVAQTIAWSRRAGDAAFNANAYPEALAHYQRAFALTQASDQAAQAGLRVDIGKVYSYLGDLKTSIQHLEEALSITRITQDDRFTALTRLAYNFAESGAYQQASSALEQTNEFLKEKATPAQKALQSHLRGHVSYRQGDFEDAKRYFQISLAAFQQTDDRIGAIRSLNGLGLVALRQQAYATAAHHFQEALANAKEIGDLHDYSIMLHNLGLCAAREGRWEQVEAYEQESFSIAQTLGDRRSAALALMGLAELYAHQQKYSQAHQYLLALLRLSQQSGSLPFTLAGVLLESDICNYCGEHMRAAELAGLVQNHPATPGELLPLIQGLLERLQQSLSENQLNEALARGKTLDLETVTREILEQG